VKELCGVEETVKTDGDVASELKGDANDSK